MSDQKLCPTCGTEYPLSERFCPRDGTALRSANAQADLLGSIIADRYHILKKLGEGGMGTVYLAEHVKMGRKSALKVMNPGMNTDPDAIARFNREASNASRLSHPNICGIYDFGETSDGMIYLAMEFIEGSSLTSMIETAGSLPAPRVASIIHQTGDALQVAHDAGIVHRDLKPDNIMVTRNRDGSDLVKVVDFGIAKASSSDAQKVTKTGLVVGTPEYMSPEQLAGDKLDGRSDIYSLGLVAFNCLTGKLPFPAETAQEAMIMRLTDQPKTLAEMKGNVAWSPELQATLDKALQRDAEERYASAAKFGRDFAAAIAAMPMTAAAEAGTMIVGAQGGGAETPVPATRVSRNSAATVSLDASRTPKRAEPTAAAPRAIATKRSSLPMVIGGVGGVAAIAVVAWQMGLIGGAGGTVTQQGSADTSSVRAETLTIGAVPTDPGSSGSQTRTGTGDGNPTKGGATNAAGGTTGGSAVGGQTSSDPAPPPPTPAALLAAWLRELDTGDPSEAEGRKVLAELRPLMPSLTGAELEESYFVLMLASASVEDVNGVCSAARRVKERHPNATKRARSDLFIANCP